VPFDRLVPFIEALRASLERRDGASGAGAMIELKTWEKTGAPEEHAGFGTFGNEAKNAQVEFLARVLRAVPPETSF
jgi:hypothetical protein